MVSGIPKNNNHKKPQDNLPLGDLCQLLTTFCDDTVASKTILIQTSSPVCAGIERRALSSIELVYYSLCSLCDRADGVISSKLSLCDLQQHESRFHSVIPGTCSYKGLSGRPKINIILNSICKRRNVNMHWIDLCFLRMEKNRSFFLTHSNILKIIKKGELS